MITVKINGKDYEIEYGLRAAFVLENELKMNTSQIINELESNQMSLKIFSSLFYVGLLSKNRGMTLDRALSIIDQIDSDFLIVYQQIIEEYFNSFSTKITSPENVGNSEKNAVKATA